MPNQLLNETSPYLLQHAHNPVDWYPWGRQALEKAQIEDKPIFLSIGYSACHWCHVMAHESFEDSETAELLNKHYINIKVDREERPDLDGLYMNAVQALTGRGGWPMSVFLTPDGAPFYGGTYFPPQPRFGMPSFKDVLKTVAKAWQERRDELIRGGAHLVADISAQYSVDNGTSVAPLEKAILTAAFEQIESQYDKIHGGWGSAPKFPQPMTLEFLLRYHCSTGNESALTMVTETLEVMARGGMYDQLGGGFHRYSVDERWLVPHFEKMLYDNAQLARVYLHAWQATGHSFFRTITEEILDYVIREMKDSTGAFYSTQDADSEGQEGKFFIWTPDEIRKTLGREADAFMTAHGVTQRGNFEGKNILEYTGDLEQRSSLSEARRELFEAREQRVHPHRDEKVLTAWNGMMLAAFAEAARALDRPDYGEVAIRNAHLVLKRLYVNGRLSRTWKNGSSRLNAYLEDYTHLTEGLLELYQTTFDERWFRVAQDLMQTMIERYQAPGGGFFDTSDDHEQLIARPRTLQDNATPSGNAMAAFVLQKLAQYTVEPTFTEVAGNAIKTVQPLLARYPLGFAQWLIAVDYALSAPREIAITGSPENSDTRKLVRIAQAGYRPHQVIAVGSPDSDIPLLQNRTQLNGQATAYVCREWTCRQPIVEPSALDNLLANG